MAEASAQPPPDSSPGTGEIDSGTLAAAGGLQGHLFSSWGADQRSLGPSVRQNKDTPIKNTQGQRLSPRTFRNKPLIGD